MEIRNLKNLDEIKEIYDKLYKGRYNRKSNSYNKFVVGFADKIGGKILDAGCGRGHATRLLMDAGHEVLGIELSDVCCEKYLGEIPHECSDIITYCNDHADEFSGVVCMGVLEHILYEEIDATLQALSKAAPKALFAIANHSDTQAGAQLHIIQEDQNWWEEKILKSYDGCNLIKASKNLYIFECAR